MLTDPRRIQERLRAAVPCFAGCPDPFPGDPALRDRYARLVQRIAHASSLTDDDASIVAKELFDLFQIATDLADFPVGAERRVMRFYEEGGER